MTVIPLPGLQFDPARAESVTVTPSGPALHIDDADRDLTGLYPRQPPRPRVHWSPTARRQLNALHRPRH